MEFLSLLDDSGEIKYVLRDQKKNKKQKQKQGVKRIFGSTYLDSHLTMMSYRDA